MKNLIKILEDNGYKYYINQMVIWYGKERYDNRMECNYLKEIGGEIGYERGFQRIIDKEMLQEVK